MSKDVLKAPYPYFGGKAKVADMVWERLGDCRNYVEPFAGSLAMLLRRPEPGKIETVNDLNAYIANFWRAVQADPAAVANHADWTVNETDLHARHRWLVFSEESQAALQRVRQLPDYFDAKIAGWWCWGACCWIGSGWCPEQLPHMSSGQGVNKLPEQLPHMDAGLRGCVANSEVLHQKRPVISGDGSEWGRGVHGRPQLADAFSRGRGVNGNDNAGTCDQRRAWLIDWMLRLADRLRPVRVCCGHWSRICDSPSTMTRLGLTGAFLDPPYRMTIDGKKNRSESLYSNDGAHVDGLCDEVQSWCLKWGNDPEVRIALCGLEGEYPAVESAGWECVPWKASGGYGNQSGDVNENAARERIWFSPHCIKPRGDGQGSLFGEEAFA